MMLCRMINLTGTTTITHLAPNAQGPDILIVTRIIAPALSSLHVIVVEVASATCKLLVAGAISATPPMPPLMMMNLANTHSAGMPAIIVAIPLLCLLKKYIAACPKGGNFITGQVQMAMMIIHHMCICHQSRRDPQHPLWVEWDWKRPGPLLLVTKSIFLSSLWVNTNFIDQSFRLPLIFCCMSLTCSLYLLVFPFRCGSLFSFSIVCSSVVSTPLCFFLLSATSLYCFQTLYQIAQEFYDLFHSYFMRLLESIITIQKLPKVVWKGVG